MDARRKIQCPTCTIEFTLDVPRTWVRCPSCGHGFVVKRVSREVEAIAPPKSERPTADAIATSTKSTGWVVTGPDGTQHRFERLDELRAAIVRGDLEDAEPESAPMDVSLSEIEIAPRAADSEVAKGEAEVLATVPSGNEIAPGVAVVPLERLERRTDAPPSGERDRAGRRSTAPMTLYERAEAGAPASVRPRVEALSASEELSEDDVTELADNDDIEDDGAELEPSSIDETPLLLSTQTSVPQVPPTLPPPSSAAPSRKPESTKPVEVKIVAVKKPVEAKKADRKTATSVARSIEPETPSRSWTLPLLGVAAVGAIAWVFMGPRTQPEPSAGIAPTAATSTMATSTPPQVDPVGPPVVIRPEAEAAVMTIPATTAISARPATPVETTHPAASASAAVRAMTPGGDGGGADAVAQRAQASAAFRAGDLPTARLLYEQIVAKNAHDVEAWSALGDTARAQRSMADAESAYRRALGVNPRYLPALIGLADISWDNGDRAGAQKRYVDLTEHFPLDMLPERVKTRAQ